jgi:hypothetical protein
MFDMTLLHPYWSPPDRFTLRAGDGRHEVVTLADLAALIARCEETGDRSSARRLAAEIDRLCAIAAGAQADAKARAIRQNPLAAAIRAAEAYFNRGSNAQERAS